LRLSTLFVGKLTTLMIVWLLFNALEMATCGASMWNSVTNSVVGKLISQFMSMAYEIFDTAVSTLMVTTIQFACSIFGDPKKRSNSTYQRKTSNRKYCMRSIPWKRGALKKVYLCWHLQPTPLERRSSEHTFLRVKSMVYICF
jgi:hypothetical protein